MYRRQQKERESSSKTHVHKRMKRQKKGDRVRETFVHLICLTRKETGEETIERRHKIIRKYMLGKGEEVINREERKGDARGQAREMTAWSSRRQLEAIGR